VSISGPITALLTVVLISSSWAAVEDSAGVTEREYPVSLPPVKLALQQLGAYTGSRLPTLDGFIKAVRADLGHYERPYYEYKIELVPTAADRTMVRVRANVSAWYTDAEGRQSGYVAFESNGRLEGDLLNRLNEFLVKNKSVIAADPDTVARQIATARQQQLETDRRILDLEKQLQAVPAPGPPTNRVEMVSVSKVPVPIFSAPEDHASVLLRAQPDDAFEVLEHRGTWLRIGLGDKSGWVKHAQVQSLAENSSSPVPDGTTAAMEAFAVIRETASPFSGEWGRLQGKQALYLWARPQDSIRDVAVGKKLKFVEMLFKERYLELAHNSQNTVGGIVVIFLDQRGGVAAATVEDIARWTSGSLTHLAFLKKCSLDPPGAFENPGTVH
jgi:hypothetical protein